MALTSVQKKKVTKPFQRHTTDTGSPEYQIGLFTEEIRRLTLHLKKNKNDNHSRRGLLGMVAKRRRMLTYLEKTDEKTYKKVIKKLGLKK